MTSGNHIQPLLPPNLLNMIFSMTGLISYIKAELSQQSDFKHLSIIAILSCLWTIGLAAYTAVKRTKEIMQWKVLSVLRSKIS